MTVTLLANLFTKKIKKIKIFSHIFGTSIPREGLKNKETMTSKNESKSHD